jgi:hypothetical protein
MVSFFFADILNNADADRHIAQIGETAVSAMTVGLFWRCPENLALFLSADSR